MLASLLLLSSLSTGLIADPNMPDANSLARSTSVAPAARLLIYRQEADIQPQSAKTLEAHRKLALEYLKLYRKTRAIATCREMIKAYSRSNALGRAVISIANTSHEAGDYVTARAIYNMILANWPEGDISVRARKAFVLMDIAVADEVSLQKSLAEFCDAHKHRRDMVVETAFTKVAQACLAGRPPEEAGTFYDRVLEKWPDSSQVRMAIEPALILEAGDAAREEKLKKLLQDGKIDSDTVVVAVADEYLKRGENGKAYELCDRLLSTSPGSEAAVQAISLKAKVDTLRGNTAEGLAGLTLLHAKYGSNSSLSAAVLTIADGYRQAEKKTEAGLLYEYAVDKWPTDKNALRAKASRVTVKGQTPADITQLVETCFQAPDPNGKMFENLFLAGMELRELADREYAEGEPAKGKSLLSHNIALYELLYRKSPTSRKGACRFSLGECYRVQGMYTEAIGEYEQSLLDNPMGNCASAAQFMIGECYRALLDQKAIDETEGENKMIKAYRKVLLNFPGGPMAREAKARLGVDSEAVKGGAR